LLTLDTAFIEILSPVYENKLLLKGRQKNNMQAKKIILRVRLRAFFLSAICF